VKNTLIQQPTQTGMKWFSNNSGIRFKKSNRFDHPKLKKYKSHSKTHSTQQILFINENIYQAHSVELLTVCIETRNTQPAAVRPDVAFHKNLSGRAQCTRNLKYKWWWTCSNKTPCLLYCVKILSRKAAKQTCVSRLSSGFVDARTSEKTYKK